MKEIKKIVNGFLTCFAMYTSIPMPACSWEDDNLAYMFCFFPLIGVLIAILEYGWILLADLLAVGAVFRGAICVFIPILVSGGIHLDGFLDTMDAISSWRETEERLRILKDPHMGAFAVISAGVYFVLDLGIGTEFGRENILFAGLAFAIARCLVIFHILQLPRANPDGTVAAFYQRAGKKTLLLVNVIWLCVLVAFVAILHPVLLLLFLPEIIWYLLFRRIAMGYFGGITGDLAGFFITISELLIALFAVIICRMIG